MKGNITMLENIKIEDFTESRSNTVFTPIFKSARLWEMTQHTAKAFPNWTFVAKTENYSYDDEKDSATGAVIRNYYVKRVEVFNNGQKLGSMYIESWGKSSYIIDNERIKMMRERGSGIKSSNLDTIVKQMKKYFTDLTLPEKLSKHYDEARWAMDELVRDARYPLRTAIDNVMSIVKEVLTEKYEKVRPLFIQLGVDEKLISEIPDFAVTLEQRHTIEKAFEVEHTASVVFIEDDKYVFVRHNRKDKPIIRSTDDIQADVKQTIGMLKLMENGGFIPDRGYKVKENLFVVMDDLGELND